jgi:hypothetical protein
VLRSVLLQPRRKWLPTAGAFVVALCFSALVTAAVAHQHYNPEGLPLGHGFVHGSSNTDGSFHSRVESGAAPRYCEIDTLNHPAPYLFESIGDFTTTCNVWSGERWQSATECIYRSETDPAQYDVKHHHRPVNYCG